MSQSYTSLLYHLVFATKDRRPIITPEMRPRLYDYLGGTIRQMGGASLAINGMGDHTHLLVRLTPDAALADIMSDLKANSSKWVNESLRQNFAWQGGYSAFTVSESQADRVRCYIYDQEAHHRQASVEKELTSLLRAHGVDFDPACLWT